VRGLPLFSLLAAIGVVGCKAPDDGLEPAFVPQVHAFEGKVDPKLVGTWTTADGVSTLDFAKDGTLNIQTLRPTPSGKSKSSVEGKWLASDGSLVFKYGDAAHGDTVLKYVTSMEGSNTMSLQQEGGRQKTVYKRK
jgi:hypothetical protein